MCGMNTMYLWDSKAGSFVGFSAITVSRAFGRRNPSFARNQAPFIQLMASNFTDPLLPTVGLCS